MCLSAAACCKCHNIHCMYHADTNGCDVMFYLKTRDGSGAGGRRSRGLGGPWS